MLRGLNLKALGVVVVVVLAAGCNQPVREPCVIESITFGVIETGMVAERVLTVRNDLSVRSAFDFRSVPTPFAATPDRFSLEPGESQQVRFSFAPRGEGVVRVETSLQNLASCEPQPVLLGGSGVTNAVSVNPPALDFGVVGEGASASLSLRFRNASSIDREVELSSNSLPEVQVASSFVVPAKGERLVPVTVTGRFIQPRRGALVFTSAGRSLQVDLSLNEGNRCLVPAGGPLTLPAAPMQCATPDVPVTFTNLCDWPVSLSSVTIRPPFFVTRQPQRVQPGETASIDLRFVPRVAGPAVGALNFEVDDGRLTLPVSVPVKAIGLPPGQVSERFEVFGSAQMDVIVIADEDAWTDAATSTLATIESDLRLMAMNTDGVRVVTLSATLSSPYFGKPLPVAGRDWVFPATQSLPVPLGAHGPASCMRSLRKALDEGRLEDFFRWNKQPVVICLTNQRDAETRPYLPAAQQLVDVLNNRSGQPLQWHTAAHLQDDDSVCSAKSVIDDGRLRVLPALTSGGIQEWCVDPWNFFRLGVSTIPGLTNTFALRSRPDFTRAPLQVFIAGVEVPSRDGLPWVYDPARNSVLITDLTALAVGDEVRIEFTPACGANP